jgi:LacI family transcriptional regulator
LIDLDHGMIAIVTGPDGLSETSDRLKGYTKALEEAGIRIEDRWIWQAGFSYEEGERVTRKNLDEGNIPTAIFACNDLSAVGVCAAVEKFGLGVPDDISLVGFDNILLASLLKSPLTTVAHPIYQIGMEAVNLLMSRIKRKRKIARRVVLPTELIVRGSTARNRKVSVHANKKNYGAFADGLRRPYRCFVRVRRTER